MRSYLARVCVAAHIVGLSSIAFCDTATVSGSSGNTTVTETVGSSGWWVADTSAETATIRYDGFISVLSGNRSPNGLEFKCIDDEDIFGPKTLNGLHDFMSDSFGAASISTSGETRFSAPTPGIPRYYQTSWVTTASISGTGAYASSGTYDPWPYTVAALQGLGMNPGSMIDFYFQVRLGAGSAVVSGPNSQGTFSFNAYGHRWNDSIMPFLSATVNRTPAGFSFSATQSNDPNVSVYRLPAAVALDDTISPGTKAGLGTLMGANGVQTAFGSNLTGIGAMIDDLHFGVIVRNFEIPVGLNPEDVVFATHFDTYAQIGPVPEPATVIVLGSAALLAMYRRRRSIDR
jgi:hypothetical protein